MSATLLATDELPSFVVENEHGISPFVLICDHAANRIPRALSDLGVSETDRARHIGWDIGAAGVASRMAVLLDAILIRQTYSRLVIDCNRPLDSAGSIVVRSEATDIPGNVGITASDRARRAREIFEPYHDRISAELDARQQRSRSTILVSVHSFTPTYLGQSRPWHIGMLYGNDTRVATILLGIIRGENHWTVGDNQPYAVTPTTDYAIPVHGEARGLPHIGLEIRQDLITDEAGQIEWAQRIARWLEQVPAALESSAP
ncbi:MAG: N-formylglutamate amidohydrolase [Rudaea sp.]